LNLIVGSIRGVPCNKNANDASAIRVGAAVIVAVVVFGAYYKPGLRPKTQRRVPSGLRQIVSIPSGGAIGIASSNGTSSPSTIQPDAVDEVRV
jgi:hypothetical protein